MSAAESFAATGQEMFVDGSWGPSRSGETYEATSPATGEVIGTVAQGDREDAQARHRGRRPRRRRLGRPDRLRPRGRACTRSATPSRRAATSSPARSRSTRASRCARRPTARSRSSSTTGAWRPRTPSAWAASCPTRSRPASGCMLVRRPLGVVGVISPWNWPYTMPAELIAPALACGNTVVWTPAPSTAVCAVALAALHRRGRPPARRVQPRDRPGAGGRRRDRRQPRDRTASAFIGSTRPGGSSPRPRRARSRCSRWAATARSSSWTTPTSTPRSRRRSPRATCAPGRAARPASASSCTAPCATSTSRSSRAA